MGQQRSDTRLKEPIVLTKKTWYILELKTKISQYLSKEYRYQPQEMCSNICNDNTSVSRQGAQFVSFFCHLHILQTMTNINLFVPETVHSITKSL